MIEKTRRALTECATELTSDMAAARAMADQWLHAIAYGHELYGAHVGVTRSALRAKLQAINVWVDRRELQSMLREKYPLTPIGKKTFRFIDLFAGIGGMRLGFQNAGGSCVFSSEYERNAQATYLANYGELPFGDITKIPAESIPDHDVLVAGFPCQPFSHAGLKLGIDDTRGTLFHDIARILEIKKPAVALLENVKGLISHDKGYTLQVILKTLSKIGYQCNVPKKLVFTGSPEQIQNVAKKMVLKSCDFGVPQNRQRIFIVLWKDPERGYFEYPVATGLKTTVGDILENDPDSKFTISDRLWFGHQARKIRNEKNGKGFGFSLVTHESAYTNTISARYYKDGSEILIAQPGKNPRKLTPREAARLQGFPEEFIINPSNMQAWKQFGNSVSVPVVEAIARKIRSDLL